MTKMKKSGKWNFLQSLTNAFRKKRQSSEEVTGNPEPPFASCRDTPTANQSTSEIEVKRYEALPEARHNTAAEIKKIASTGDLVTDLRPSALDLDEVRRETGLTNNAFAHHKAKIQPKRRAPGKYTDRLTQRSNSLDRLSEDSAAIIAENSESSDRPSMPAGSLTPDSGGGLTDGSVNDLFELSSDFDSMEKTGKAARIAKKHSMENIQGKEEEAFHRLPRMKVLETELPTRACETGSAVGGTVGTDPGMKTAGARSQHGSTESLPGERAKASGDVGLEAEDRRSNIKVLDAFEPTGEMSRSAKGSRKLPRTYVATTGRNDSESLVSGSSVLESNIWETSGVGELSASGSSLDSVDDARLRENRRKSLKALKTDSKVTAVRTGDRSKDDGKGVGDAVKESVKVNLDSNEMNVESELKAPRKKDKDEKKSKRRLKVGFADEASAGIGVLEHHDRPEESVKGDGDIWADVDQSENLAESSEIHLPDSSLVYHDGKNLFEKNEQTGPKRDVKAPAAATAIPPKSSRKDGEVKKTERLHEISDVNETVTKRHAPVSEVVESAGFNKAFPKVRRYTIGDVTRESDKIKGGSTDGNELSVASAEKGAPGDGNAKSAAAKSIPKKLVSGDSVDVSGADVEKICGIEPSDRKTRPLDDSRDASSAGGEVGAASKNPGNKTKSDNVKTALRSSTENVAAAAAVDAGKAGHNAPGEEPTNELDRAFEKVRAKPQLPGIPSNHSSQPQSTAKPSSETQLPHSDDAKGTKNISVVPAKSQVDALGRSLGGSRRRIDDPKSAGSNSTVADSKKLTTVTAEADKAAADGDGSSSSLANKAKLPPAPVAAKRLGKVQPKPAENETEVAWVNMARRLSKDFSNRLLSGVGAGSEGQKVDNEVGTEDNFERGGVRTSVKDLVKKIQQKN